MIFASQKRRQVLAGLLAGAVIPPLFPRSAFAQEHDMLTDPLALPQFAKPWTDIDE